MRRGWGLLAAVGVVISSVACGTGVSGETHRAPASGRPESRTSAAANSVGALALAGSFLMDLMP
jgi:hypothetical protein